MSLFMLLPLAITLVLLGCIGVGRRLGARSEEEEHEEVKTGVASMEGAVFALFGLLLAFSFSGAAGRFDARRELILEETNAVGTLWLRLDLLPPDSRPAVQELLKRYVDARIAVYAPDADVDAAWLEVTKLQGQLWTETLAACTKATNEPRALMLITPALNDLLDLATSRYAATKVHPPIVIFVLLYGLAFGCAGLAGWRMARAKKAHWVQRVCFAAAVGVTLGITTDLELPRKGVIRVEDTDQLLVDQRKSMR